MCDKDSLQVARSIISQLSQDPYVPPILVVATKADDAQSYQVTSLELEDFAVECNVPICLINNMAETLAEIQSSYLVVEELCDLIVSKRERNKVWEL